MGAVTDKNPLSPNKRGNIVENDEYAQFMRRAIRAYARRVASGDIEAVAAMTALSGELDDAIREAIAGLHRSGYSWTEIAARLGVSRQGARQRWMIPGDGEGALWLPPAIPGTARPSTGSLSSAGACSAACAV